MTTQDEARAAVQALVAKWQALSPAQLKGYNEESTKKDFILPLFKALGWNVDSSEVAAEQQVSSGRVDYAFIVDGVTRLYLEAKPLRDETLEQTKWIEQAISYGYNKGVPWVVLTNFRQFMGFNTLRGAKQATDSFPNLTADLFLPEFEWLWLFSREALLSGALDEKARVFGKAPTLHPVEQQLYAQMGQWREDLFNSLHQYMDDPKDLRQKDALVDEIIQRLFNRLIFIRTCEDRKLEEPRLLPALRAYQAARGKNPLAPAIRKTFDYYNDSYDSELFQKHAVDTAHFDDEMLAPVIRGLHEVAGGLAQYDFSLIDPDVLGQVYEQYLGHVAVASVNRLRERQRQARLFGEEVEYRLEEKRAKRKAGGIYYTPRWVTDYIVRKTLGRFIEEHAKRPNEITGVTVLDPACGSGSFLIRAYSELLDWEARRSGRPLDKIDQTERVLMLQHSIYGVDLDPQAVQLARLNLLLRALGRHEHLPPLADNVKRGNSLVSGSESDLRSYFGDGWQTTRQFNWGEQFPAVMERGGFDVIVGNPPYVRIQTLPREEAQFFREHYETAHGSFDLYVLFIERSLQLLKPGGSLRVHYIGKISADGLRPAPALPE
ncbi:MAG: N-6 DNA methylase [Chloroflexi bacterium]|nr:N-6 DNA methylase [Chloroflexota bacterium]